MINDVVMPEATLIIGAGQAGCHAAMAMRDAGYAGAITLIGDEAELPYGRPMLSKQMLTEADAPQAQHFYAAGRYDDRGIALLCGSKAVAIDPVARHVALEDGRVLAYTNLLLATGGRARRLQVQGAEHVLYLRTLEDARLLRPRLRPGARIVCIGAGVIGLEIAASAVARGCTVTVVEPGPQAMGRSLTPEIAAWLAALHRENGVTLMFGTGIREVTAGSVLCTDGRRIEADVLVAGIGMERNTELAEAAGLAVEGGIVVDEFGRTSAPGIYAAGDVAAFWMPLLGRRMRLETWRHAQDHGAAVGRVIAGQTTPYNEIPWFWTDQHGINLQMTGTMEGASLTVIRGTIGVAPFSAWHLDAAGNLLGVVGVNAPRDIRAGQALIRAGRPVDARALADVSVSAQKLAQGS
jgi:3-phenylpropionate/trans-cinnamate dioxygenase ferredoxin reductase subunit